MQGLAVQNVNKNAKKVVLPRVVGKFLLLIFRQSCRSVKEKVEQDANLVVTAVSRRYQPPPAHLNAPSIDVGSDHLAPTTPSW